MRELRDELADWQRQVDALLAELGPVPVDELLAELERDEHDDGETLANG